MKKLKIDDVDGEQEDLDENASLCFSKTSFFAFPHDGTVRDCRLREIWNGQCLCGECIGLFTPAPRTLYFQRECKVLPPPHLPSECFSPSFSCHNSPTSAIRKRGGRHCPSTTKPHDHYYHTTTTFYNQLVIDWLLDRFTLPYHHLHRHIKLSRLPPISSYRKTRLECPLAHLQNGTLPS